MESKSESPAPPLAAAAPVAAQSPKDELAFLKEAAPVAVPTPVKTPVTEPVARASGWNRFTSLLFRSTSKKKAASPLSATPAQAPVAAAPAAAAAPAPATLDSLLSGGNEHEQEIKRREEQMKESAKARGTSGSGKPGPTLLEEIVAPTAVAPAKAEGTIAHATPALGTATPPGRRKSGSGGTLQDFMGSIKYLGLGKERNAIIQNLATMLNAGLQLIDSLKALQMESRYKPIKKLLGSMITSVENGTPLWRAMEMEHFFSPQALALVRIGEEAGSLAQNLEYLAQQQEKDQALKSKVKMAMIYPSIVGVLMFIVVMGLGVFVLPNLIGVLTSLNVPLPLVTKILIQFTNFMSENGTIIVPGSVIGIVVIAILAKFTPLRVVAQWIMFHIPGIGSLAREATIASFGVILGGLMQAGVPLVEALRSLEDVTPVVRYKRFYKELLDRILLGDSFAKSFANIKGSQKILPLSVQQLVTTGERSGTLSKILLKVADIYEKKANETAQRLPVILEPLILLFIGGLVGTIALAIIVPIYGIVGNLGK